MRRALLATFLASISGSLMPCEGLEPEQSSMDVSLPLVAVVPASPRDLSSLSWWTLSANEEHARGSLAQLNGTAIETGFPLVS